MSQEDDDRYVRQVALFGVDGQRRIADAKVAVLGLGGLGSHLCQQLAYLGARHFTLVDDDVVADSNLNRLIGALRDDVGAKKTEVASRMISSIQATAQVEAIDSRLPDADAATAVVVADLLIGAFDNDYPRLLTTAIASQAGRPYIDAATDVLATHGTKPVYGGRVVVAGTSPGCLSCLELLDQDEIRRAQLSDDELATEAAIYGVPVETLRGTGPSVVSLNGVVASLAGMEAMVLITGLRPPVKLQTYYGSWGGRITSSSDQPRSSCYYCGQWLSAA